MRLIYIACEYFEYEYFLHKYIPTRVVIESMQKVSTPQPPPTPELEPNHQIQFRVILIKSLFGDGGSYSFAEDISMYFFLISSYQIYDY